MNWLERARREIRRIPKPGTADTAEGNPMAVMTVPVARVDRLHAVSIDCNDSVKTLHSLESDSAREAMEERAAIMEFDGGLSREDAERAAAWLSAPPRKFH